MWKFYLNNMKVKNYALWTMCAIGHSTRMITPEHLRKALIWDTRIPLEYFGIEFAAFLFKWFAVIVTRHKCTFTPIDP